MNLWFYYFIKVFLFNYKANHESNNIFQYEEIYNFFIKIDKLNSEHAVCMFYLTYFENL